MEGLLCRQSQLLPRLSWAPWRGTVHAFLCSVTSWRLFSKQLLEVFPSTRKEPDCEKKKFSWPVSAGQSLSSSDLHNVETDSYLTNPMKLKKNVNRSRDWNKQWFLKVHFTFSFFSFSFFQCRVKEENRTNVFFFWKPNVWQNMY